MDLVDVILCLAPGMSGIKDVGRILKWRPGTDAIAQAIYLLVWNIAQGLIAGLALNEDFRSLIIH
jgi:hypothetical protein